MGFVKDYQVILCGLFQMYERIVSLSVLKSNGISLMFVISLGPAYNEQLNSQKLALDKSYL